MTLKNSFLAFVMAFSVMLFSGCQDKDLGLDTPEDEEEEVTVPEIGITNIENDYSSKSVSYRGETVSIKFDAHADWTAFLVVTQGTGEGWVKISSSTSSGKAKEGCTVRVVFEENEETSVRVVELWAIVDGFDDVLVATLRQAAAGESADTQINSVLNKYMHDILKEDYLFADAYNSKEVDLTIGYGDFLNKHLLRLGLDNEADGGYYRLSQENSGDRYIYTNIVEIQPVTKAVQTSGLGFGPFLSSSLPEDANRMAIAPAYVRQGSPAEAAGLRRGDMIIAVNGMALTTQNYKNFMNSLYQSPSGAYKFTFKRFEENEEGGYSLMEYTSGVATAGVHVYNPVLHASILSDPDNEAAKIGYLVYETFDLASQDILEAAIDEFAEAGITDLILDLRFNVGGAVAQSRWLSGCIAGEANGAKTFTKVVYNDGSEENWTFDYGYNEDTDNLGKPTDLGLERLYVITSYNTASAAELVISSLRGIDFPVYMIGCRTEGKNVGMTVSNVKYQGRTFQFSPVTFWVRNAKGWGDYADGIEPDEYVNNDNLSYDDDADNVFPYSFADWGNMDYNIALQWAYCSITGKDRWSHTPETKSSSPLVVPMEAQSYIPLDGKYGNMIEKIN